MNEEEELTQEDIDEYNKRRQEEYDEATKGNEEIRRKQEEEKSKGFRDAGSAFRTTAAIGTEVGLNTLLDLFSFIPPAQVVGGSAINYLAQRIRGGEFSQGEFVASGLASLIPGGAQAKSVLRDTAGKQLAKGIGKGAVSGALETGAADFIDTGKIDAENVLVGAGAGGLFGGAFTTAANIPQIQNLAQRIRTGTGNIIESLTPGPVRIAQGDLIGNVTAGQFSNNAPKNLREWRYRPPDATQSYKVNQTLLNSAVLDNGKFSTKLYEDGKINSQWRRMVGINYQTNPNTRVGWEKIKRELRHTWEGLYGQAMKRKGYTTEDIQIEHIFTIQQSMPIYEGVRFGSDLYNQIQARILRRGYDPGNTDRNLMAILPHLHQQKTNYFNALHGKDGRKFFTQDMIDRFAAGDNDFRFEMLDKYLDEIDKGKKILNDAIEVFDSLNVERGYMPEEIAERLGQIELNDYSAPELKKIFSDMQAEGFKLDPKQSAKAEATEIKTETKASKDQAKKDAQFDKSFAKSLEDTESYGNWLASAENKFQGRYDLRKGLRDDQLRVDAEEWYNYIARNSKLGQPQQELFDTSYFKNNREEVILKLMKDILKKSKRSR